ncbi:helix-turn-helix domain-containing protein [uncultured Enterovirga sp.]|uniref:helix-turn-helix domain-containing protein n=1 Tax=uncultured Enterovirga sp. TaxID=2026352 RepID=UPI0035CBC116
MRKTLHSPDHAHMIASLRRFRKEAGLTQQQVAARLGVPQSFVAKYERGERRLDVLEFVAVARALEMEPRDLLNAII